MKHPADVAFRIVEDIMFQGLKKHGNGSWRQEGINFHISKAEGHLLKLRQEQSGLREPDGENHIKNALTRLAMASALLEG